MRLCRPSAASNFDAVITDANASVMTRQHRGVFAQMPILGVVRDRSAQGYRAFCIVEDWVLVLILAVLTGSMFIVVFFRFVLNDPVIWADILPRLLMIWLTFLGAARAVRTSEHIVVDYFARLTPGNGKYLQYIIDFFLLFFLVFLFWIGVKYTVYAWRQNAAPLNLPYSIFTAALPAFAIIALIHKIFAMATRPFGVGKQEDAQATNMGAS